jgi:hypothetical protein
MPRLTSICLGLGLLTALPGFAAEHRFSLPLDYHLIRATLVNQLYTGEGESVRAWQDGKACSFLDLADPQLAGQKGQIKMTNRLHVRFGTKVAGQCMPLIEWSGLLETLQQPTLSADGTVVSLPITQAKAIDAKGQTVNIAQLQDLIKQVAEPKLADLKLDLNQQHAAIVKTLAPYVAAENSERLNDTVNSLRFTEVSADDKALHVEIGIDPGANPDTVAQQPPLSADELQQWRSYWKDWSGGLQKSLQNTAANPALAKHKATLQKLLDQAGRAFEQGLSADNTDKDPVRQFFNSSWDQLGPLIRSASEQLPGAENLRYLTLIAATDLIYQVEGVTAPFGLDISSNSLRQLARRLIARPETTQ